MGIEFVMYFTTPTFSALAHCYPHLKLPVLTFICLAEEHPEDSTTTVRAPGDRRPETGDLTNRKVPPWMDQRARMGVHV